MHEKHDEHGEDDPVARILSLAGRRPEVMAEVRAEIKRAAYPVWQRKVRQRAAWRQTRRYGWLAAAALLTVTVGLLLVRVLQPVSPSAAIPGAPRVATLEAMEGGVRAGEAELAIDDAVAAGAVLRTEAGGLASLRLASGAVLRLDASSRVLLRDARSIVLEQGAVYFDSAASTGAARAVAVHTPLGIVHDIGTQFAVRLEPPGMQVQVREGEVELERTGSASIHSAVAGTALLVGTDGAVTQRTIEPFGAEWAWVLRAAPAFELEGRPLADFLAWVSREAGWQLRYADPRLEEEVAAIIAHGSVAGLRPDQALELVLPSSGLAYRVEAGSLLITRP